MESLNEQFKKAVLENDFQTARRIFARGGIDINYRDKEDHSLLQRAIDRDSTSMVEFLVNHKADPNSRDLLNRTPVHQCAAKGNVEILKILIRAGGDIEATDVHGAKPSHMAASKGETEVLVYLKSLGHDLTVPKNDGRCSVHLAATLGKTGVLRLFHSYGINMDVSDNDGCTPVHHAAQNEKVDALDLLNAYGVDMNAVNDNGDTPLHSACYLGKSKAATYLFKSERNTSVEIKNKNGLTPLDLLKEETTNTFLRRKRAEIYHEFQSHINLKDSNSEESTSHSTMSEDVMIYDAFKKAVSRRGSLTCYVTQCMPFGPPRVGKTCLYHRLLDKNPPGTPSTHEQLGGKPDSTDVLTERKMIQVRMNTILAQDMQWSEVNTLEDEIAMYLKSVSSQQGKDDTMNASLSDENVSTSKAYLPASGSKQTEDTPGSDSPSIGGSKLDDTILNAIIDNVKNEKKVDLVKVQELMDKSLTIFYTDTGGQPEFHEVLPALIAGPVIFILAFNLIVPFKSIYDVEYTSSDLPDCEVYKSSFTVEEVLMQCLSSIASYHNAQSQECSLQPKFYSKSEAEEFISPPITIFAVGTHSDLVESDHITTFDKVLREAVADTVLEKEGIMEYFNEDSLLIPIDNYNAKDGKKFRQVFDRAVKREKADFSPYKVELPIHWLALEIHLRQQKSSTIGYKSCFELGKNLGIEDEEEFLNCLWYLHHRVGTIRYYNIIAMSDVVITNPSVLFKVVTEFITSTFSPRNVNWAVIRNFQHLGLFKKKEVQCVFDKHKHKLEISFQQFTALLQHLCILGPTHDPEFDYFLPCALVHAPTFHGEKIVSKVCSPLLASFPSGFIPKGAFSGILAYLCSSVNWKIKRDRNKSRKPMLFRNQATFAVSHFTVTMTAMAKYIEFSLDCHTIDDISEILCKTRCTLQEAIMHVLKNLGYQISFMFGFYCSLSECGEFNHFAEVEKESKHARCSATMEVFALDEYMSVWFQSGYMDTTFVSDASTSKNRKRTHLDSKEDTTSVFASMSKRPHLEEATTFADSKLAKKRPLKDDNVETSTTSKRPCVDVSGVDYLAIFNENFARLVDAVSNPVILANCLSSADLISERIAMNIPTITGEGVYEHSTRLFNEVRRSLQAVQGSGEQEVIMQRFCKVLYDYNSQPLRILADQILNKAGMSMEWESES